MSIFPAKILLATDGSEDAQLALSTAEDPANSTNSGLHVIPVAPGNPDPVYQIHEAAMPYEAYEQAPQAVRAETQKVLDEQVEKVEGAGGTVAQAHLRMGERRDLTIV